MAAETQYTANTGLATINVANSSLSGGTIGTNIFSIITGASNGTLIETVTIKATGSPSQGMIRLFTYNGTTQFLLKEIAVDPIPQTTVDVAFEKTIQLGYILQSGFQLLVTTQNADTFNIIAQGLNISYFTSYIRAESTNYIPNIGMASISVGTSSMTGTGSTLLMSATSGSNGTIVESIGIKAIGPTSADGMIRIFIYNGTTYYLLSETFIPFYETSSSIYQTFEKKVILPKKIKLKAGYSLYVSTQNSDLFTVFAEGTDWSYPPSTQFTNYSASSFGGNMSEHLLRSYQIPAGLFTTGNLLEVYGQLTVFGNTHGKVMRIYINSTNSLTGAVLVGICESAFVSADNMQRFFPVTSDTTVECYDGTVGSYPQANNQYQNSIHTPVSVTTTSLSAGFWLLISGMNQSSADTTTLVWSMVRKVF